MWRTRGRGNELFKVCERLLSIGRNISCIFFLTEASVKEAHRQEREDKDDLYSIQGSIRDIASMDFRSTNSLNVWLNLLSGNLLPMTGDGSSFPLLWRIYGFIVLMVGLIHTNALIAGFALVPREKALRDGMISFVVIIELFVIIVRIHTQRAEVRQLIRKLDDSLRFQDETMRSVLMTTLSSMKAPFRFYFIGGSFAVFLWCSIPFQFTFRKSSFYYVDYQSPVAYSKEPFSGGVYLTVNVLNTINNMYLFVRKVAVDVYMTHLVLLITAQHRYTALKLVSIFRDFLPRDNPGDSSEDYYSKLDRLAVKELKTLCRHHIYIINLTLMLKKLLSLNFSLIYVNGVFRFCSIAIMLFAVKSTPFIQSFAIIIFSCGEVVQLYVLCSCVQKLLDASTEITDEAFHEDWHRFGPRVKRIFLLVIMASNVGFKLSTFDRFNLSLPSFTMILNQSYSIALLILKMTSETSRLA